MDEHLRLLTNLNEQVNKLIDTNKRLRDEIRELEECITDIEEDYNFLERENNELILRLAKYE